MPAHRTYAHSLSHFLKSRKRSAKATLRNFKQTDRSIWAARTFSQNLAISKQNSQNLGEQNRNIKDETKQKGIKSSWEHSINANYRNLQGGISTDMKYLKDCAEDFMKEFIKIKQFSRKLVLTFAPIVQQVQKQSAKKPIVQRVKESKGMLKELWDLFDKYSQSPFQDLFEQTAIKVEKSIEQTKDSLMESLFSEQQQHQHQLISPYLQCIKELEENVQQLERERDEFRNKIVECEQQYETISHQKQEEKQYYDNTIEEITDEKAEMCDRLAERIVNLQETLEEKQNEINQLKAENSQDLINLEQKANQKEQKQLNFLETQVCLYKDKILELEKDKFEQREKRKELEKINEQLQVQCKSLREQSVMALEVKKTLLKDMKIMNSDFYKHWAALRSIKKTSLDLSIFRHFSQIFTELRFEQKLFVE